MNRANLQEVALIRVREAETLRNASEYSGAYYLSGYAVECALKACIAKSTRDFDFPEKSKVNESHTHDLNRLLRVAGLEQALKRTRQVQPGVGQRWNTVEGWSEVSRYVLWSRADAESMLDAVTHPKEGVLRWLVQHW